MLTFSKSDVMNVADEMVNAVNAFSDLQDSMHDYYPISSRHHSNDIHHDDEWSDSERCMLSKQALNDR